MGQMGSGNHSAVNEYNYHLSDTPEYVRLDWRFVKAMAWVETGAANPQWHTRPLQIGVPGDPGLSSFLNGQEGGNLITPINLRNHLSLSSCKNIPAHNIRAGIGYLLMRMARFDVQTVLDTDKKEYTVTVKPGDSLDKIAKNQGTTLELLKIMNPGSSALRPGEIVRYKKASLQKIIVGWRTISTSAAARLYNGNRDANYAAKLDYALKIIRDSR